MYWGNCSMRTQLLAWAVASACVLGPSLPAAAQSAPQCGTGFKLVEVTGNRITCLRNTSVGSVEEADKLAQGWQRRANCVGGEVSDSQAGIGEESGGAFLVTVRFACTGD
jgi:hypothetical protein